MIQIKISNLPKDWGIAYVVDNSAEDRKSWVINKVVINVFINLYFYIGSYNILSRCICVYLL